MCATNRRGFTLIELLVVLAIVALMLTIAAPRTIDHLARARETTLQATLKEMRLALDQFHADRGRPAKTLDELVERRYLKRLPVDPITERDDTWVVVSPSEVQTSDLDADAGSSGVQGDGVVDVHSGAEGEGRNGRPYAEW